MRDALRLLEEQEELRVAQINSLREKIQEGINSGAGVPADKVLNRLEAKYAKLARKP